MSKPSQRDISISEQSFIVEGCRQNCRQDGRACHEIRAYMTDHGSTSKNSNPEEESDPLVLSHGSARVFLPTGELNVLVSVRAGLAIPSRARPDEGMIAVNVDLLQNDGRRRNDELESTLTELLVPHLVNRKDLCVVPHHYVWKLYIDLLVLSSDGGSLLDACGRGIQGALASTRIPVVTQVPQAKESDGVTIEADNDFKSANHIPGIENPPYVQTVTILKAAGEKKPIFILDATKEEELCAVAQVHVVLEESTGGKVRICALHKSGGGSLPFALLQDLTTFVAKAPAGLIHKTSTGSSRMIFDTFMVNQ
jgi:exosome complex RNA-binding protein Rrp42 (RNase PH superfamily)